MQFHINSTDFQWDKLFEIMEAINTRFPSLIEEYLHNPRNNFGRSFLVFCQTTTFKPRRHCPCSTCKQNHVLYKWSFYINIQLYCTHFSLLLITFNKILFHFNASLKSKSFKKFSQLNQHSQEPR